MLVQFNDSIGRPHFSESMIFDPDDSIADFFNVTHIVANKQYRHASFLKISDGLNTFSLKSDITYCQNFINN
ncbi:Uncharacterised protein [Klebsiella pneumoniae]|uniref:Uncharacterized protein n=1 Tax=Klebsiella pneumoniae TaxID=573 RepID=A0A377W112_KLEPN|nr:Uncharacterised protein [Klebsiella pneumoniae]VXZ82643.1 Uncharacterised protein [Klebsiella pneumoniae]